jgi:hypothetical protein
MPPHERAGGRGGMAVAEGRAHEAVDERCGRGPGAVFQCNLRA